MVRAAGLAAARASARAARPRARRAIDAPHRAHRRRQDARRLPADADRAPRARPAPEEARVDRSRGAPRARAAHALHLAAQGARRRHRPQPGKAGCRDEAADPHRDAHRRHAHVQAHAPAQGPARHSAHDAGADRAVARVGRRAVSVRHLAAGRARRAAFAGDVEARRSLSLGLARLAHALARVTDDRALGDRRQSRGSLPLPGAAAERGRGARRAVDRGARSGAARHHARARRISAVGWAFGAPFVRRDLRSDPPPQDHAGVRQHAQPSGDDLPRAVEPERR